MSLRRPIWASQRYPGGSGLWRGGLWTSQQAASLSDTEQIRQALFGEGQQGALYYPKPMVDGVQVLWQDEAGTNPVTADGQSVGKMDDLSGNGHHATQPTTAVKPIYRTNGTLHWLQFDGVEDFIRASLPQQMQPLTLMAAGSTDVNSGVMNFIDGFTGSNSRRCIIGALSADEYRGFAGLTISGTATRGTSPHVVTSKFNGASSLLRHDGAQIASGDAGGNSLEGIMLGSDNDGVGQQLDGNMYGAIVVISDLSASDIDEAENYLADLAGVTL